MLKLYDLTIDYERSPACARLSGLRLGWKLDSDKRDVIEESYRVIIGTKEGCVFDSGVVGGSECVNVVFDDLHLASGTEYEMTVFASDNYGESAESTMKFSTCILPCEWVGKWIKPKKHIEGCAPYLRKKFATDGHIRRAVLYASGLGCAEYYINGKRISDDFIDPPMTNYEKEVFYRAFDVTAFLDKNNALTALLGDGWYSQSRVWGPGAAKYGDVCLAAQLVIEYQNGNKQIVATDDSWMYKYSPIMLNNFYGGETYDSRFETPDFADADGSDEEWGMCRYDDIPKGVLTPCNMPPVRIIRTIPAVKITNMSGKDDGAWQIDMGENFAGIAEFHLPPSPRGAQYVFRFAETVNDRGQLDYRSIGSFATQCLQQDVYIASGNPKGETWRPRFTYHGFRYIEITGYHDLRAYGTNPELSVAVGYALSTDLRRTGTITTDNEYINRLQKVMMNTFRSNYHGFPEDCPAREKCGWLGDAEIVCNTAIMNYNMASSYEKYLHDIRTETEVYGVWQMIAPGKRGCGEATSLWGCAQIILPYWMYMYYSDKNAVNENRDLMERWVEHELSHSEDLIISQGFGDWDPPGGNENKRRMPVPHSSSMMFYEICDKMSQLARIFNWGDDRVEYYSSLASNIKASIIRHFYNTDTHSYGYWGSDGVALTLGIYPDGEREKLVEALINAIKAEDYEMHTGIYGNKYLIPALCHEGYGDEVLKFMFTKSHPSFATMLDDNGTSLWECLDMKHIQTNREIGVASYNHPMHSGFAYFYYADIAGIRPIEPGFKKFMIAPCEFTDINRVDATYETPYGMIGVRFEKRSDGRRDYSVTVPVGTVCEFTPIGTEKIITLGSGTYTFDGE